MQNINSIILPDLKYKNIYSKYIVYYSKYIVYLQVYFAKGTATPRYFHNNCQIST
jgi:hypothetical protein